MSPAATVTIASRFCGPPSSGNGGYSCGVLAKEFGRNPAEVSLLKPPPLDRPLQFQTDVAQTRLLDGDTIVAIAGDGTTPGEGPTLSAAEIDSAAAAFDLDSYKSTHAFPDCFTCGPGRAEDDGLRIFPGETKELGTVVWPWRPRATTADSSGLVSLPIVWAALDCPSGWAWWRADPEGEAGVLGRMNAAIHRRPEIGERLLVTGWRKSADGRKRTSGAAIRTRDGELLAASHATWIVLTAEQRAAFEAAK
ncbi:MAG TPA: hotdog fold domain-containing protein [Acidimicrobiales bacterium]|nr:hotdog fold domain-containing protein [Acidimicrobiales bacterium]